MSRNLELPWCSLVFERFSHRSLHWHCRVWQLAVKELRGSAAFCCSTTLLRSVPHSAPPTAACLLGEARSAKDRTCKGITWARSQDSGHPLLLALKVFLDFLIREKMFLVWEGPHREKVWGRCGMAHRQFHCFGRWSLNLAIFPKVQSLQKSLWFLFQWSWN